MHGRCLPDHSPFHSFHAGTERVEFSPTRKALLEPSAKRGEVFGQSHEGCAASYQVPFGLRRLVRISLHMDGGEGGSVVRQLS